LQEYDEEGENDSEEAVIGFGSGFVWLVIMTVFIAILSEYVVDTIEVTNCLTYFYFYNHLTDETNALSIMDDSQKFAVKFD
jgi:hypothetical protein